MPPAPSRSIANHPIWDVITKVAAPGALAIGAACYLTGYTFNSVLLRSFGLGGSVVSPSVQELIAQGYPLLLIAILGFMAIAMVATRFENVMRSAADKWPILNPAYDVSLQTFYQFWHTRYAVIIVLCIGFFSGGAGGEIVSRQFKRQLREGCLSTCVYYKTKRGSVTGIILLQDKDRAIILGRNKAYVISINDILSTSPVNGRHLLSDWR